MDTIKMGELFNATYTSNRLGYTSIRDIREETLDAIYADQDNGEWLTIKPVIWIDYCILDGAYVVRYDGADCCCNLMVTRRLAAAEACRDGVDALTAERFSQVLGYIRRVDMGAWTAARIADYLAALSK